MGTTKKQTAVEWFESKLKSDEIFNLDVVLAKAKEMEKEQIIDFSKHCLDKAKDIDILTSYKNVEQYYNETYGR